MDLSSKAEIAARIHIALESIDLAPTLLSIFGGLGETEWRSALDVCEWNMGEP